MYEFTIFSIDSLKVWQIQIIFSDYQISMHKTNGKRIYLRLTCVRDACVSRIQCRTAHQDIGIAWITNKSLNISKAKNTISTKNNRICNGKKIYFHKSIVHRILRTHCLDFCIRGIHRTMQGWVCEHSNIQRFVSTYIHNHQQHKPSDIDVCIIPSCFVNSRHRKRFES